MTQNNVSKAASDMRSQDPEVRKGGAQFMAQYRAHNRKANPGAKPKAKPPSKKK